MVLSADSFASGYVCDDLKEYVSCSAGYYLSGTGVGNSCKPCPANSSTEAGNTSASCTCNAGYSVDGYESGATSTTDTACQVVQRTCSAGYYLQEGLCKECPAGTYQPENNSTAASCTVCAANTYSNAKASSCTACATSYGYSNSGTTAESHAGVASCKVACSAGQMVVLPGTGCVSAGGTATNGTYSYTLSSSKGWFTSSHTVAQGAVSPVSYCPNGYTNSLANIDQLLACQSDGNTAAGVVVNIGIPAGSLIKITNGSNNGSKFRFKASGYPTMNPQQSVTGILDPHTVSDNFNEASDGSYLTNARDAYVVFSAVGDIDALGLDFWNTGVVQLIQTIR